MNALSRIRVNGYKSIRCMNVELRNVNVLIGGNGAGKSNLFSFFEMIQQIENCSFEDYVMKQGGANKILYNGRKETEECQFEIESGKKKYFAQIVPSAEDGMFVSKHGEMLEEISDIGIYHFHDTSVTSLMKAACNLNDNEALASDGRNIASILYRTRETDRECYERIVCMVRMAAPYFQDFLLRKNPFNPDIIRLEWKKRGCEIPFGAEQLSDGTLRFICMVTLFNLPRDIRKKIILLDEPELGLHPFAITLIAELIKKYAAEGQVLAATQSADFVNEFKPDDIIVVENQNGESVFRRIIAKELEEWLEDYTLGELWKKNVIGGKP